MIVIEDFKIKRIPFVRTYSDEEKYIRSDEDGELYEEAEDPAEMNRTYTETDIPLIQE